MMNLSAFCVKLQQSVNHLRIELAAAAVADDGQRFGAGKR